MSPNANENMAPTVPPSAIITLSAECGSKFEIAFITTPPGY